MGPDPRGAGDRAHSRPEKTGFLTRPAQASLVCINIEAAVIRKIDRDHLVARVDPKPPAGQALRGSKTGSASAGG